MRFSDSGSTGRNESVHSQQNRAEGFSLLWRPYKIFHNKTFILTYRGDSGEFYLEGDVSIVLRWCQNKARKNE